VSRVRQQVVLGFGIALGIVITAAVFIGAGDRLANRWSGSRAATPPIAATAPPANPAPRPAPDSSAPPSSATNTTIAQAPNESSAAASSAAASASSGAAIRSSSAVVTSPSAPDIPPRPVDPLAPSVANVPPGQVAAPALAKKSDGPLPVKARELIIPVEGVRPEQLTDTYNERRGGTRPHEALDIMAPRGTPVRAAADGRIVKLFDSKPGGLTIYEFDPTESVAYYYAHLDRYAGGIQEGQAVRQGDVIGYVGSTGNASPEGPHLHFAIFRLGPEKRWWQGTPVNPFPYFVTQ
jgi:murein DD-endopeptidase MepM/ murein hydrolase activator NlpD